MDRLKFTAEEFAQTAKPLKRRLAARRIADKIAHEVFKGGFPESFQVEIVTPALDDAVVTFELDDKKINDSKSHHQIIFSYGLSTASHKVMKNIVSAIDDDESDTSYLTSIDTIEVIADFSNKFDTVWGEIS